MPRKIFLLNFRTIKIGRLNNSFLPFSSCPILAPKLHHQISHSEKIGLLLVSIFCFKIFHNSKSFNITLWCKFREPFVEGSLGLSLQNCGRPQGSPLLERNLVGAKGAELINRKLLAKFSNFFFYFRFKFAIAFFAVFHKAFKHVANFVADPLKFFFFKAASCAS